MGRVGWGDWVDASGKVLDPVAKQRMVTNEIASRPNAIGPNNVRQEWNPDAPGISADSEFAGTSNRWTRLDSAQSRIFSSSELGTRVEGALNRLREAVGEDGAAPAALWRDELRKLGIEPGQIGAPSSGVTLVTNPGDRQRSDESEERSPRSFLGKAWSWLTEDFPGLVEEKAQSIARLDREIKAIEAEPGWRRNILNLYARQSLLEARTGIIGGFPTSRLDFALAGIDVIGVGMVSGRPLIFLKKGSKVITSADLAEGGFRSRQALDLGKDVPYDSHMIRTWLERRHGAEAVISPTIPSADYRLIQLAGKRHPVTGIVFDTRGYPIFDDVARFDTRIPSEVFWRGRIDIHKQTATLQLREAIERGQVSRGLFSSDQLIAIYKSQSDIPGFRWHHHQRPWPDATRPGLDPHAHNTSRRNGAAERPIGGRNVGARRGMVVLWSSSYE